MNPIQLIEGIALADLIVLLAGSITTWFFRKSLIPSMKWLLSYLFMVAGIEILAKMYVYEWLSGSNLHLLHIYAPLEFALLSLMYLSLFKSKRLKWILGSIFLLIVVYSVFNLLYNNGNTDDFATYSKLVVNGSMVGLSCLFFMQCLRDPARHMDHFNALGFTNSGILLYFAGSFIIYLILNELISSYVSDVLYLWVINAILTFIFHLTCIIALWQKDSRLTKTSPYG
ncbi:MAG: hypothetical protein ACPF9D_00220 [Owenweeksia sp.]